MKDSDDKLTCQSQREKKAQPVRELTNSDPGAPVLFTTILPTYNILIRIFIIFRFQTITRGQKFVMYELICHFYNYS